jgi:general secretion pathway protein E
VQLAAILVESGRVSAVRMAEAERTVLEASRPLRDVLLEAGDVTAEILAAAEAQALGIACLIPIPDDVLDAELIARLPVEWARLHRALPILRDGSPAALLGRTEALGAVEDLAVLLGRDLVPVLTTDAELDRAIEQCYFRRKGTAGDFARAYEQSGAGPAALSAAGTGAEDLLRAADGAPVTQLVNLMLLDALRARASDIHVEPFEDRLRVRFRVDGLLYEQSSPPKPLEAALTSRLKVMARMDIAERRLPQDGMARVRIGAREIDIRVSTVPVAEGERIVLRLLNRDSALLSLGDLGMEPGEIDAFRALLTEPQGIVLVTGPTGSGKTTTLYAALQELDTKRLNILTIEDPIEYQLPFISQMQVNPRIDLTFARLLRHVLRQDPDVVLVGETRDLETAEIAIRASLTGHLVFTTLHTNDAAGAAVRMADMGVEPYLLSASLKGVLAQRLVRRLCPDCRVRRALETRDLAGFGASAAQRFPEGVHWVPVGCPQCLDGYRGRVGLYELLVVTPAVATSIRTRAGLETLRRAAVDGGMRTLLHSGLSRAAAGGTSLAEIARALGRGDAG